MTSIPGSAWCNGSTPETSALRRAEDSRDKAARAASGFRVFGLPGLLDSIGPAVIALPAVDRMIDARTLFGGMCADARQPFAVRVPALLIGIGPGPR